jgi:hypothetical protein
MTEKRSSPTGSREITVPEGSERDAALRDAQCHGEEIELVPSGLRYQLVPLFGDTESAQRAWRSALAARSQAIRDSLEPLGMTTAELVRERRGE